MYVLAPERQEAVERLLIIGQSLRGAALTIGCAKGTVARYKRLLRERGVQLVANSNRCCAVSKGRICSGGRRWRRRAESALLVPLPEVWPFITDTWGDEHEMVRAIDQAVPKSLPEFVRQEVCQELAAAILSGDVDLPRLAAAAPVYTRLVYRRFPSKYGPLSLDRPCPWGDDDRTLGELLSEQSAVLL